MKMFLFNRKQRVKRWLVDRDFIEAKMTEQINAAAKLVFSVPLEKRLPTSYFFAAIPQPRGSGYLLFKIVTEQVQSDRVQYTCVEAAYDELKSYHYIKDDRPQNRSAADMLRMALDGTRWGTGTAYDAGTGSTNFYYISSLEAIQKIANLFQLEVVFSIVLDPRSHQITRRLVNLYAQQGQRTGKRFEYGSNLLSVEREESSENLITALIGRGKGEEIYHTADGKASEEDQTPDGYGRRINFADVVWSTDNGNPVDKPAGQEYVEDPDATAAYGFDDGKPRIGIEIFEDITDPGELLKATWSALQTLKRPKVSFKANTLDVGDLGLGDTVAIIRHDIKIEYFTRVYKVEHNLLNEKQNTIELGDDFNGQSITSTVNSIASTVKQASQTANYASMSANGKNTNNYGKDKPAVAVEGDLWYKDLGNGEVDLYQYHDGNWVLITSTRDLHNVQKQVDKQVDDMKKAEEANKKRDEEINKSIADTKKDLETAKADSATRVKNLEDDAADLRTRLDDVASEASKNADGITEVTKAVGQVQTTVADTQGKVSQLTIRAGKIEEANRDALGRINVVETTAEGNKQTIATAQGDINQLTKRADKLELDTKDATGRLNQLEITATGLKQTTTTQTGQINQFKIDIDGLKNSISDNSGKIVTIQTDISGIRNIVSTKADTSYVDQKANEWSVTVKQLEKKIPDGVNPNLLDGTADWSGSWGGVFFGDLNAKTTWYKDGWTDPEGNPALCSDGAADVPPLREVYLYPGVYTISGWAYQTSDHPWELITVTTKDASSDTAPQTIKADNYIKTTFNKWVRVYKTFKVLKAGLYGVGHTSMGFTKGQLHVGSFKLENGDKNTAWIPSEADHTKDTGALLSRINLDAGKILFQSKKLYLDADTTVIGGKAFITDAAIKNVSADKMTTGTLNAGNVNIINMNANNIVAGTIKGANLSINLNSGEVEFQHGRIHNISNTVDINLDQAYISTANWNTRALLKNGELQLTQPTIYDTSGGWYFRLYNDGGSVETFAGASLVGRDNVTIANKENYQGGLSSSPIGVATFAGLFVGKGTDWMPTMLEGAERGVFIKGGASIKSEFMHGGPLMPGSPYISIGSDASGSKFWGNRIVIDGEYVHIPSAQRQTTGNSPNVFVADDGALVRSTSASKYKTMIARSHSLDYGERLLSLPTATWLDKAEERRFASGESKEKPVMHFGMIAEDLASAGLEMLVSRGLDGELEGIQYDRIAPALLPVIKNLQDRIEKLEEQLNGTKSTIN